MIVDKDVAEHRGAIKSFPAAMLDYFGKNGKDNVAFMGELKALSDSEKAEYREMLKSIGYTSL